MGSCTWEFLMAWEDKRKLTEGSRQEEFEEFLRDQVSKTPPSYYEIYGLHISGRNRLSGQKRGYFTCSFSGFLLFLDKLQIVNSMAFKLSFLKGKCNSLSFHAIRNSHARDPPANLSSPSVTQGLKLIHGRRNARIKGLVTKACSHASLSLFIVMCYVKLDFTCCATFYAATKTHGTLWRGRGWLDGFAMRSCSCLSCIMVHCYS